MNPPNETHPTVSGRDRLSRSSCPRPRGAKLREILRTHYHGGALKKNLPTIAVSDERGVRSLHVGGEAIQSSMRLGDPFALALDYTRCMMAFLLFHPEPR